MTDWLSDLPAAPNLGDILPKPERRPDVLAFLAQRRSLTAAQMTAPGPAGEELNALLRLSARVPDHRRVHPFRFLTFTDDARAAFGEVLAEAQLQRDPASSEECVALEKNRFLRAPVVVAVISSVNREHKTPEWEQILTAGAVAQNLVISATASGYAAQWLTEWYAYDAHVLQALGLEAHERVVGFVYIGTAAEAPKERARMDASELTAPWTPPQTPN